VVLIQVGIILLPQGSAFGTLSIRVRPLDEVPPGVIPRYGLVFPPEHMKGRVGVDVQVCIEITKKTRRGKPVPDVGTGFNPTVCITAGSDNYEGK
jgi:hypothetical protein